MFFESHLFLLVSCLRTDSSFWDNFLKSLFDNNNSIANFSFIHSFSGEVDSRSKREKKSSKNDEVIVQSQIRVKISYAVLL